MNIRCPGWIGYNPTTWFFFTRLYLAALSVKHKKYIYLNINQLDALNFLFLFFYILLTVHLNIFILILTNLMH